jgi:hypothetical protein
MKVVLIFESCREAFWHGYELGLCGVLPSQQMFEECPFLIDGWVYGHFERVGFWRTKTVRRRRNGRMRAKVVRLYKPKKTA